MDIAVEVLETPLTRLYNTKLPASMAKIDRRLKYAALEAGQSVLVMGCGPGYLLPEILKSVGPEGQVVGIESQAQDLQAAQDLTGKHPNLSLHLADAAQTHLDAKHFDRVICHHSFHGLSDRGGAVREFRRLLKSGGLLFIWEPRLLIHDWHIRVVEGMFLGSQFQLNTRKNWGLGAIRVYEAIDEAPGSRLR